MTRAEVSDLLTKLKTIKSVGSGGIYPRVVRELIYEIVVLPLRWRRSWWVILILHSGRQEQTLFHFMSH